MYIHMYICYRYMVVYTCIFSPQRACTARVTVLGPCVSQSVCLSIFVLEIQATRQLMSDINN